MERISTATVREMKLYLILVISLFACQCYGTDQIDRDSIRAGQPIPRIVFENVVNFPQTKFSTKELNHKPAILYFFSTACRASFSQLSEINQLYHTCKKDFALIMVGIDLNDNIQRVYEEYCEKYKIKLPTTFDQSAFKKYNIRGVPYVIWIRRDGVVQAITNVLYKGYLEKFVADREFEFIPRGLSDRKPFAYNREEPFLVDGNGGQSHDFIQRSLLAKWRIGMPNEVPIAQPNQSPLQGLKFLQVIGRGLDDLYRLAYYGRTYWYPEDSFYGNVRYSPVLEIQDDSTFKPNYKLGRNLFCYSQVLPPRRRSPDQMMEVMQRDLKNFFGYDVSIEIKQMPYLSLVVVDAEKVKLLTNSHESGESSSSLIHINYINKPISSLINLLDLQLNLVQIDLPLIDETGIKENIDISFEAIMTDFGEVKAALRRLGLDIVKKERPMKTIIIREARL